MDVRAQQLAISITKYSLEVQPGDFVVIDTEEPDHDICKALIQEIYHCGGMPHVLIRHTATLRRILQQVSDEQLTLMRQSEDILMKRADCYIILNGSGNNAELTGVPQETLGRYMSIYRQDLTRQRLKKRWLVLRQPTAADAQAANMDTDSYSQLLYQSCLIDYPSLLARMLPLQNLMEKTDQVRITAPGTDLTFSIRGIPVLRAAGKVNLPDGEVYTAPVRTSINGTVCFNTKTVYQGCSFQRIDLSFREGKVVSASSDGSTKELNAILDIDEGARYVGEFALGLNHMITNPVGSILFDEKIGGSFHLALGSCYEEADNGNHSAIHWDLVCRMQSSAGGGTIYFDGVPVMKDGEFCLPELAGLTESRNNNKL